jgi:hypothetical protein
VLRLNDAGRIMVLGWGSCSALEDIFFVSSLFYEVIHAAEVPRNSRVYIAGTKNRNPRLSNIHTATADKSALVWGNCC